LSDDGGGIDFCDSALRRLARRSRSSITASLLSLIAALLCAGCGVVGEPLPPLLEIPSPVSDLSIVQVGTHLELHWTVPPTTTEGTRLGALGLVEIYLVFLPANQPLTDFAGQAQRIARLENTDTNPLLSLTNYSVPLEASQIGQKVSVALKLINPNGKDAGFSNIASAEVADAPGTPSAPTAMVTEKAIQLTWKPAPLSAFGGPPPDAAGYEIYRSDAQSAEPAQKIGTAESTTYDDGTFAFGNRYRYFVRAFVRQGESTAVTPDSPSVEVAAEDVFPPAPPRNLRAIAVPHAVEMAWSPNSESDLAGYNVYRSTGLPLKSSRANRCRFLSSATRTLLQVRATPIA